MKKSYDILATLYLNDTEDGELMEKVRDIFSIDVEPSESVLESFKDTGFGRNAQKVCDKLRRA